MLSGMVAFPAWADGGRGGAADGDAGWAGGTGWTGNPGQSAQYAADDGGGGGGAGGGAGGQGSQDPVFHHGGGNGGTGGLNGNGMGAPTIANTGTLAGTAGGAGGDGDNEIFVSSATGGGGGGAGGYGAVVTGAGASSNSGTITGGTGGSGGTSQGSGSEGGGGGGGGVGLQLATGGVTFTNSGSITGGNGGSGGFGYGALNSTGGAGGNGGDGVNFSGSGTLVNTGFIQGGNGASGGGAHFTGTTGANGVGGAGVVGAGITVINGGSIAGGVSASGVRANAITFTGGTNMLVLQAGATFVGNVVVAGGTGTLALGGASSSSFDVSQIGSLYQGFTTLQVASGTWSLTGSPTTTVPWTLTGGVLSITSDSVLGPASSGLIMAGGTLQTSSFVFSSRSLTLVAGTMSTITTPDTFTLQGLINGGGGLIVAAGTFQIGEGLGGSNASNYTGPTIIQSGATLQIQGGAFVLSPNSAFTIASGGVLDVAATSQTIGSLAGGGTVTNSVNSLGQLIVGGNNTSTTFSGNLQDGAGPLSLVKSGTGTMILSGVNSYSGGTTVQGGILQGSSSGLQGNIVNNAAVVFDQGSNGTYAGSMSGSGSLTKIGAGSLRVSGASTYSGPTSLLAGRLHVTGGSGVLSPNSAYTIASGAVLDVGGAGQTIAALAGSGTVTSTGSTTGTLTTGGNNASTVFSGNLRDGEDGGRLALVKTGAGTLNLTGSNTYGGGTTVLGGILQGDHRSLQGNIANDSLVVFHQNDSGRYAGNMSGAGILNVRGVGVLHLTGSNSYTGGTILSGVILRGGPGSIQGDIRNDSGVILETDTAGTYSGNMIGSGGLEKRGRGTLVMTGANSYTAGTFVAEGTLQGNTASLQGTIFNNGAVVFDQATDGTYAGDMVGSGSFAKSGAGTLFVTGLARYQGATTIQAGTLRVNGGNNILAPNSAYTVATGAVLDLGGTTQTLGSLAGSGTVTNGGGSAATLVVGGSNASTSFGGSLLDGTGSLALVKTGNGTLFVSGASSYSGPTSLLAGRLQVTGGSGVLSANSAYTIGAGATLDLGGTGQTIGSLAGSGTVTNTGTTGATLSTGGNNATTTFGGNLQDGGGSLALVKTGTGTLNLLGANSYSGGTTVTAGILQGNSASLQGAILNNATVVFDQDGGSGSYGGAMTGSGSLVVQGGGQLTMTGTSSYAGPTTVNGTTLVVNGSLASAVTLNGGALGGSGSVGSLVSNGATLMPGNSIGTLTVNGSFVQAGGTYQLEVNGQRQNDRINVTGAATINGGTVAVTALQGSYANSTTYTILNAGGGVTGTYAGITENLAFLTPTLSYDANNVFLTLALQGAAFSGFEGNTPNQAAVGYALDQSYATATGDFATVIGALAGLTTQQAPAALNAISGQPWADMGTANVAGATLFMNAVAQQMQLARGAPAAAGQRQALAQACDVAACEALSPFSVWGSLLGGTGSVGGDSNASTLTYTMGGAAAGIDYRVDPRFLVGLGVGYSAASMWVDGFQGKGWSNAVSFAAYGSFAPTGGLAGFYADVLAGYGYSGNQMQRQITIPNLAPRTASGSTGVNQFLGQAEIGWQVPVYAPAQASVTPFARFQAVSSTQSGFSEGGAGSLGLNVQQQTTNALRTVLGADLAGAIPLGDQRTLELALRLGWQHEYAYTGRPITAAFSGAPQAAFTVYGATPQRDAAVVGFSANTRVAEATQIYLRYDGELATGTDNHALTAGLRISW
ncbi:MAG: autotransporter domain-containing protein [Pseudomonadota bacterium]